LSTLKEIRRDLKKKGASREDIEIALELMVRISSLDELVFSKDESCLITLVPTRKHVYGFPAAYSRANGDEEETYLIFVNGIADFLKKEKSQKKMVITKEKGRNRLKLVPPTWDGLLVPMAAHEVRHRVQRKLKVKKFSPKAKPFDEVLKWTIEFYTIEFEERKKIYIEEGKSQRYIKDRINPREFDASVIESFVASRIRGRNAGKMKEEIASIIKQERLK